MAAADALLISAGDVIDVQLTSETVVIENAAGRRAPAEPGHITNRMRLFVRELDGTEKKYDFEETELGVRETQRVAIVRAKRKRDREPFHLILFNLSSGERDVFEDNVARYLSRKPLFGPLWKAAAFALAVTLIFYLVSHFALGRGAVGAASLAIMFGFLTTPVFWWLCGLWDRLSERMRYKRARAAFIAEMETRVASFTAGPQPVG